MASRPATSVGVYIAWPQQTRIGFVRCRSVLSNRSLAIKCFNLFIVQNDPPSAVDIIKQWNVKHDSLHPATGWSVAGIQVTTTLAMSAVGEMKNKITDLTVAPSSSQAAVMSELPDDTSMALPRRATVSKALRRHRKKVTDAANGDTALPAIPKDLLFDIPESFADIVVFDSGPGDNRLILICDYMSAISSWTAINYSVTFLHIRPIVHDYMCRTF